jgi:hypothetical protein
MSVRVDLDGLLDLLARNGGQLLSFTVRSDVSAADPEPFVARVRSAIDAANVAAGGRNSADPLWSSHGDLVGSQVHAQLAKGDLTTDEVRCWFADLEVGLAGLDIVVAPLDPGALRVPDLDPWISMPPSVTAFLSFTADVDGGRRTTPRRTVEKTADALTGWSRFPGAMTVVWRGATSFVVPPGAAVDELRTSASLDEQHALWHLTTGPRRARAVDFKFRAKGSLQVVDDTRSAAACLPDLLSGLRVLAPYVDYAWVRRATTALPDERDTVDSLGRPTTEMEELASGRRVLHLLHDYAVDAYVAQVLTSAHLARTGTPDGYIVEPLGRDRHLVVARDPEPWLSGLEPEPALLARARRELGGALLNTDVVTAN